MIDVSKVPSGLVNLTKTAADSLQKHGLTGTKAAVYLVLDHSGSMYPHYQSGAVQHLAEQALGLSANLDDDGSVPLIYFGSHAVVQDDVRLDNYQGVIDRTHTRVHWGSTNYPAAIGAATREHKASGATDPGLVIFQSDGDPDSAHAAEAALRSASHAPLFFAFVGFGKSVGFLQRLDTLTGRSVDNASFFHAVNPLNTSDADLYDGITREYGTWLTAARTAGIIRNH
ncbi:toxic cation resistance protein [Streptomyces camponoticapitis]|uniref:Toxic cation resistance protein n=1 Tax=Streptomyces camponoticapitis TaxID=1616125 RepID=A0ABQ2E381_9ACTN|nr:VWA domain-containing protein [Streptomyces camponoticapitis]GGJ81826.1 toxic cation resistance protein [Streptomyces camponoticapitis]